MEMVLALAVVIAVIIFGGLISVGNERQRRAIEGLREQVVLWAMQDLNMKREKLVREIRIDKPLVWINTLTTRVVGYNMQLRSAEYFDMPVALVFENGVTGEKAVFSPLSPMEIRQLKKERRNRLSQYSQFNPIFSIPRNTAVYEISVLNAGPIFDLELRSAWTGLTGQNIEQVIRLWLYVFK